jgi:hypothetical protein
MTDKNGVKADRRTLIKDIAAIGSAAVAAGGALSSGAQDSAKPDYSRQIGLELYSCRYAGSPQLGLY